MSIKYEQSMAIFAWEYFNRAQLILIAVGQARDARAEAETDERGDSEATWYRDFSFSSSNVIVRDDDRATCVRFAPYLYLHMFVDNHVQEIPYDTKFIIRAEINYTILSISRERYIESENRSSFTCWYYISNIQDNNKCLAIIQY